MLCDSSSVTAAGLAAAAATDNAAAKERGLDQGKAFYEEQMLQMMRYYPVLGNTSSKAFVLCKDLPINRTKPLQNCRFRQKRMPHTFFA
jgi:hypothetical protein